MNEDEIRRILLDEISKILNRIELEINPIRNNTVNEKVRSVIIELEFERDGPIRTYGEKINLQSLHDKINRILNHDVLDSWGREIFNYINNNIEENLDDCIKRLDGYLCEMRYILNREDKKRYEKILLKMMEGEFSQRALGEYFSCENKIVLYIKSINENSENLRCDFEDLLKGVFSHELFHAFHYWMIKCNNGEWRTRWTPNLVVKESLASYFEYIYYREEIKNRVLSDKISCSWRYHKIKTWPYSGAKYIEGQYTPWKDSFFKCLFYLSLRNMDDAFRILENSELLMLTNAL